jgi:hypothetical protein
MSDLKYWICFYVENELFGSDKYDEDEPEIMWSGLIAEFPKRTPEELRAAVAELQEEGVVKSFNDEVVVFDAVQMERYQEED